MDTISRRRPGIARLRPARLAWALLDRLLLWRQVARERRALRELDLRALRDIGISAADVEHECSRRFWDVGCRR